MGSGKKVLIVDDDAVILKTTSSKLRSHGYEVIVAMDAPEAMTAVRQHQPDLILLDISFPPDVGIDWDGYKIMAWLQRVDEVRHIPIIVITGGDAADHEARSLTTGAVAFFNKPIEHDELLTVMAKILRAQNGSASAPAD